MTCEVLIWPVWFVADTCVFSFISQSLVKENLKNKQAGASADKAGRAVDVAKVGPKVDRKKGGERPCRFSFSTYKIYLKLYFVLRKQILLTLFLTLCLASYLEPLMKAEEKGSGAVAWSVYGAYIKAAGGPLVFIINIIFFLTTTGSIAFSNWWLSHWIKQGSGVSLEAILLHRNWCLFLFCIWLLKEK